MALQAAMAPPSSAKRVNYQISLIFFSNAGIDGGPVERKKSAPSQFCKEACEDETRGVSRIYPDRQQGRGTAPLNGAPRFMAIPGARRPASDRARPETRNAFRTETPA